MLASYATDTLTFTRPGAPAATDPDGLPSTSTTFPVRAVGQYTNTLVRRADGTDAQSTVLLLCVPADIRLGDTFVFDGGSYTVLGLKTYKCLSTVREVKVYGG